MPLSGLEAKALRLVYDPTGRYDGVRDASYDLQARYVIIEGKVYDLDKPEDRSAVVPPQGTFTIVSREVLRIEDGFVGYAFLKTSVARQGILAINTGIIDAGWHNHLATTAINFRKDGFPISSARSSLRIAFEEVVGKRKRARLGDFTHRSGQEYLDQQVELSRGFPKSFLDIEGQSDRIVQTAKEEIAEDGWKRLRNFVVLVTIVAFVLAAAVPTMGGIITNLFNDDSGTHETIIRLEERVRYLEERRFDAPTETSNDGQGVRLDTNTGVGRVGRDST